MAGESFQLVVDSNQYFKEVQDEPGVITQYDKSVWKNAICLEPGCNNSFETKNRLMEHLIELHGLSFEIEESEVKNWQEFQIWKDTLEENENHNYVLFSRKYDKTTNQTLSLTFICQGKNNSGSGEKGVFQLEHACTSHIEAKEIQSLITIEWIKSHYGHEWKSGVKVERDLEMTDDKDVEEPIESDSIPGKAEENSINVSHETPMEVNEDSIFSLDLWVQECEGHQDNPVLFYKPSNNPMKGFSVGEFCLIVMTSFQADMLRRYPDIIAIDSTYGLEDYEFELTTVMIIDKKGELFPVAFMFTNNENKSISTLFFGHVKEKVGSICPQIFISEMTGKFHESWSESMGTISNWLFCSCHLEHIWKLNLLNVKCRDKRVWIYETLKELQLTSEEEKFINNLDSAINELLGDEDTFAFGEAFQNSYLDCVRQWVYCYRKDLGLEADIFLDSMKKMLRYPGSKKKFKKRDKIVYDILKYVRDKTVTCIVEEAEGDLKHEFNQNHDQSVQNIFEVMKCTEEFWVIKKEGEDNKFHSVEILSNTKCCDVTCCKCDICVHMYSCSCPTYFINSIICEHIHYIATNHPISKNQLKEEETDSVVEMEEEGESINTGSNSNCLPNISRIANETIVKLQNANFDTMSKDVSSQLLPHLLAMNKLLTLLEKRKR